jgi:hypothetical protein
VNLECDKGIALAHISIRRALSQLATRHEVEAIDDGET